jgi:hypothetical protein
MILDVRACIALSSITSRTRQTHRTPEPCPRTAPTTSTADESVSAGVMQPPIETGYGSGQLTGYADGTCGGRPK